MRCLPPWVLQPFLNINVLSLARPVCEGSTTLELMTSFLRAFGHTVLNADNGLDGVALASDHKPDLIACIASGTFVEQLDRFLPPALRACSLASRGRLPWP
jgi:hypothetical protein